MTRDLIADGAGASSISPVPRRIRSSSSMTAGIEAGIRGTAATLFTTHGLFSQNDTYRQVLRQAASREFDSIISASALMAIGASHALRELGMAPESERRVLLDSASRTEVLPYPHRRALMNDQRIGSEAISGLIDLIEGRCAKVRKTVPISICGSNSSGSPEGTILCTGNPIAFRDEGHYNDQFQKDWLFLLKLVSQKAVKNQVFIVSEPPFPLPRELLIFNLSWI
ncbi:MAG: hypothetical protein V8T86_08930 [Victivallis sp.]